MSKGFYEVLTTTAVNYRGEAKVIMLSAKVVKTKGNLNEGLTDLDHQISRKWRQE